LLSVNINTTNNQFTSFTAHILKKEDSHSQDNGKREKSCSEVSNCETRTQTLDTTLLRLTHLQLQHRISQQSEVSVLHR